MGLGFISRHNFDKLLCEDYKVKILDHLERRIHLERIPHFENHNVWYYLELLVKENELRKFINLKPKVVL